MTPAFTVLHGGHWGQPVQRVRPGLPPYRIETNFCGVLVVWFRWSPTDNVFDIVMTLREAVERRFVPAPRAALTIAACDGVRR